MSNNNHKIYITWYKIVFSFYILTIMDILVHLLGSSSCYSKDILLYFRMFLMVHTNISYNIGCNTSNKHSCGMSLNIEHHMPPDNLTEIYNIIKCIKKYFSQLFISLWKVYKILNDITPNFYRTLSSFLKIVLC